MRKGFGAAILAGLVLAVPAFAQSGSFRGVNPSEIKFTAIDTSKNLAAPVQTPNQGSGFSNFFSKLNPMNLFGSNNKMPTTKHRGPIYPMMPIRSQ